MELNEMKAVFERGVRERQLFERGVEVVELLQNLEQNEKNIQKNIAKLQKEEAALSESVGGFSGVIQKAKDEAAEIVDAAKLSAEKSEKKAADKAAEVVAEANKKADAVGAEVDKMLSVKSALYSDISALNAEMDKAKKDLEALEDAKDAARKALGL